MADVLPPFPSYSVHDDNASVGPRWKKWLKRFEMYLAAHDVKDATRKRALLQYSAGEEVSDLFETLQSRSRRREGLSEGRHCFEWLFSAKSKQDIRNLHVQKCYPEVRWVARFLLHTAEAFGCIRIWYLPIEIFCSHNKCVILRAFVTLLRMRFSLISYSTEAFSKLL